MNFIDYTRNTSLAQVRYKTKLLTNNNKNFMLNKERIEVSQTLKSVRYEIQQVFICVWMSVKCESFVVGIEL